ncbi:hypothetical protein [Halorubellus sp. PRR65]|uniref:hypothetical protein n=1 Tax=Halorubellus sp. PRR65 TaxID=3098148 RepID=UPI002B25D5C2|nr:hypothetical protein [Halorubellus sp. PRR65]
MSQDELSERWEDYYSTAIRKGLKAALAESSVERSLDTFEYAHIKLNKLMYVAMAERGLHEEMQHSWHRYGGDLGTLVPSASTIKQTELANLPTTEKPAQPGAESKQDVWDEADYREFFLNVSIGSLESLSEILNADRETLLEAFYTAYSGDIEEWVELYLINVRIQEVLHQYDVDGLDSFGEPEYHDFVDVLAAFEQELYSHREMSPSALEAADVDLESDENPADLLTEFLELVDDVYFTIAQGDLDDFPGDLSYQLGMIEEFYHENAWNLVTKVISIHTTHGPNADALEWGSRSDIDQLLDGYRIRMERIESECRAVGLLPGATDSTPPEDDAEGSGVGRDLPSGEEFRRALNGTSD